MGRMRNILGLSKGQLVQGDFALSGSQGVAGNPIGHAEPLGSVQLTDPLKADTTWAS